MPTLYTAAGDPVGFEGLYYKDATGAQVEVATTAPLPIGSTPATAFGVAQTETSSTTAAGAQITSSVAAAAAKTSYLTGFDVTLGPGTAGTVTVAVTGVTNTLSYVITTNATDSRVLSVRLPQPIPATAVNTAVVVTVPATGGASAANAVAVYGYQL